MNRSEYRKLHRQVAKTRQGKKFTQSTTAHADRSKPFEPTYPPNLSNNLRMKIRAGQRQGKVTAND